MEIRKKNKFFQSIDNSKDFSKWAPVFDWLFRDDRFPGWSSNDIGNFTKLVKSDSRIKEKINWIYNAKCHVYFKKNPQQQIWIQMIEERKKEQSQARALLRHIRNAIAHGNAAINNKNLEFLDFDGIEQSGYIKIPIDLIFSWHLEFEKINKAVKQRLKKKRK